jgi:hypothetical protein
MATLPPCIVSEPNGESVTKAARRERNILFQISYLFRFAYPPLSFEGNRENRKYQIDFIKI